jgi:hypothetical protein
MAELKKEFNYAVACVSEFAYILSKEWARNVINNHSFTECSIAGFNLDN